MLDLCDDAVSIKVSISNKKLKVHELINRRQWVRTREWVQVAKNSDKIIATMRIWEAFAGCYLSIHYQHGALAKTSSATDRENEAANLYKENKHFVFLKHLLDTKYANKLKQLEADLESCYVTGSATLIPELLTHFTLSSVAAETLELKGTAKEVEARERKLDILNIIPVGSDPLPARALTPPLSLSTHPTAAGSDAATSNPILEPGISLHSHDYSPL